MIWFRVGVRVRVMVNTDILTEHSDWGHFDLVP